MSTEQRTITAYNNQLKFLYVESTRIASTLMRMSGAVPVRIGDDVVFWTFSNTAEHATITAAIRRIGAHPAVRKLVGAYADISRQMINVERRIAQVSSSSNS